MKFLFLFIILSTVLLSNSNYEKNEFNKFNKSTGLNINHEDIKKIVSNLPPELTNIDNLTPVLNLIKSQLNKDVSLWDEVGNPFKINISVKELNSILYKFKDNISINDKKKLLKIENFESRLNKLKSSFLKLDNNNLFKNNEKTDFIKKLSNSQKQLDKQKIKILKTVIKSSKNKKNDGKISELSEITQIAESIYSYLNSMYGTENRKELGFLKEVINTNKSTLNKYK